MSHNDAEQRLVHSHMSSYLQLISENIMPAGAYSHEEAAGLANAFMTSSLFVLIKILKVDPTSMNAVASEIVFRSLDNLHREIAAHVASLN